MTLATRIAAIDGVGELMRSIFTSLVTPKDEDFARVVPRLSREKCAAWTNRGQ
jgi:hypothetical protein